MKETGISMAGHSAKGLADVPIQEIDLVISFDDAHKKRSNLPGRAEIENWRSTTR